MSFNIYNASSHKLTNVGGGSGIGYVNEEVVAPVAVSPAMQAYSVGDYFMFYSKLCKAIVDIAIGDELEENINYEITNISEDFRGHAVMDAEGDVFTQRGVLQFIGDGVEIIDDSVNGRTVVTIEGGGTTIVQKPTVTVGTYDYDGTAQGPTITGLDATNTVVTNATKVNAGTYILTIALKNSSKMVWDDLSNADLIYNYTINKKASTVTISPASVEINMDSSIATATYSTTGDGTVTVTNNNSNIYNMSYNSNTITITDKDQTSGEGTVTVAISEGTNYLAASATLNVKASYKPDIVTFADGTDAQIAAMLEAYYNDVITWSEMGWAVGDTRKIHLNSMQAPNPNSSNTWAAQDITIVIVAHDQTTLATPINGHTKACITVQTRECMNNSFGNDDTNGIYVNGDSSSDTTFTKWSNLYMRTYLNSIVLGSIPNGDFKSAIKLSTHNRLTTNGNNPMTADTTDGSKTDRTIESVTDTLFLPSYPEIFGNVKYNSYLGGGVSNSEEGTQFAYYQTASNRIKQGNNNGTPNGSNLEWWEGSASSSYYSSNGYRWCRVNYDGSAGVSYGFTAYWLAPAFAM